MGYAHYETNKSQERLVRLLLLNKGDGFGHDNRGVVTVQCCVLLGLGKGITSVMPVASLDALS